MTNDKDGRATLRDVWNLQNAMNEKLEAVQKDISNLKVKVYSKTAAISGMVSLTGTLLVIIIYEFIHHLSK